MIQKLSSGLCALRYKNGTRFWFVCFFLSEGIFLPIALIFLHMKETLKQYKRGPTLLLFNDTRYILYISKVEMRHLDIIWHRYTTALPRLKPQGIFSLYTLLFPNYQLYFFKGGEAMWHMMGEAGDLTVLPVPRVSMWRFLVGNAISGWLSRGWPGTLYTKSWLGWCLPLSYSLRGYLKTWCRALYAWEDWDKTEFSQRISKKIFNEESFCYLGNYHWYILTQMVGFR